MSTVCLYICKGGSNMKEYKLYEVSSGREETNRRKGFADSYARESSRFRPEGF